MKKLLSIFVVSLLLLPAFAQAGTVTIIGNVWGTDYTHVEGARNRSMVVNIRDAKGKFHWLYNLEPLNNEIDKILYEVYDFAKSDFNHSHKAYSHSRIKVVLQCSSISTFSGAKFYEISKAYKSGCKTIHFERHKPWAPLL